MTGNFNKDFTIGHGSIALQPEELEHKISRMCGCTNPKPIEVKIKKMYKDAVIPEQATSGSAGFDLRVYLKSTKSLLIQPNQTFKLSTGLHFELPEGYVMMIYPRSSTGIKKGLMLKNTVGVLDSDYRGECFLFLTNIGNEDVLITHNERLCQAVIMPYPKVIFTEVEELSETKRGSGGMGSTGD